MTEYLSAFLIGLVSSSHCLGMCGGLMVAAGLNSSRPLMAVFYNLGRISTYCLLGFSAGLLAHLLPENVFPYLQILSGIFLFLSALYLLGQTTILASFERLGSPLWKRLQPLSQKLLPITSRRTAYALGMLWGFIPCGLVYTALVFSLSLNGPFHSATAMIFFGLGTFPAMVGSALMATRIKPILRQPRVKILLAGLLFFLAFFMLLTALIQII